MMAKLVICQQRRRHGHGGVTVVVPEHARGGRRGVPGRRGGGLQGEGAPALQVHRTVEEDDPSDGQRGRE